MTAAHPTPFTPKLAFPLFVAFLAAFVLLPRAPADAVDCDAVRCSLQSQFDSQCPCNSLTSHSAYVDCINNVIVASGFAKDCNSAILNCMANSTCGQGASAVTCTEKNGKCDVRQSAAECTGAGGTVGSSTNCCPSCPSTTTTTTTTPGAIQCCIRNPACEPAFNCQIMSADQCSSAGGENVGPGTCAGFPCPTTTTPPSACCTQSTPGGPLDQCSIQGLCQCGLLGGRFLLFQFSCTPNPCVTTTTSTISSTTTTSTISTTTTSSPTTTIGSTTTTTTTTLPPIQCCEQSSPMGAFDICVLVETAAQCTAQGGIDHGSGTCSPNICLPSCVQPGTDCVFGCGTCGTGVCAANQSNTCGIHHFPNPICINFHECLSPPCDLSVGDASCPPGQACVDLGGAPVCCPGCF